MSLNILVADDDESVCRLFVEILSGQHAVQTVHDGDAALRMMSGNPFDLLLCDIRMGGLDGLGVLRAMKSNPQNQTEMVIMTGFGGLESVLEATQYGATDFLTKPFQIEQVQQLVSAVEERKSFSRRLSTLEESAGSSSAIRASEIVGTSPVMIELYKKIARVAATDLPVTIYGESGTGKELVARTIHQHSKRSAFPFVAVNCGALTETLLESELFGHQRGAFTGAVVSRRGLFEEADGGTLFLDEIGETSLAFQVRLLRALQEGEIRPVGSSQVIRLNVRVISASNLRLGEAVRKKLFREDLLYRINTMSLEIPPLRERREDIPLLINRISAQAQQQRSAARAGSGPEDGATESVHFSPEALRKLTLYDWPGNVRQLQNIIHRLVALSSSLLIGECDLPPEISLAEGPPLPVSLPPDEFISLQELERRYLIRVLQATTGNKVQAARILGIDRKTVDRMIRQFNIAVESLRK